jgi:hypothetical protein
VDVHIGGGVIPWLINLFRSQVSSAIKQEIHDQVKEINDGENKVFLKYIF